MATYNKKLTIGSLVAGSDLSAKTHYLVKVSAAGTVDLAGAGELAVGVVGNSPVSGEAVELHTGLMVPVVAGAAVAAGAEVASDANGKGVTAVATDRVFGIAVDAAGADGEEFRVLAISKETL